MHAHESEMRGTGGDLEERKGSVKRNERTKIVVSNLRPELYRYLSRPGLAPQGSEPPTVDGLRRRIADAKRRLRDPEEGAA